MNNAFGMSRHRRRPTINITSLIDVMFLLLIFFMVSSVFRDSVGLDITLPAAATATEQQDAPYEIFITKDGTITFDEDVGLSRRELEDVLRGLLIREPDARMALRADAQADYEDFVAVIDIARKIGGKRLIIHTQAPNNTKGMSPQ